MRPLVGAVAPPALHVMTFNVRRRMGVLSFPPADRWRVRAPLVAALLRAEQPAILGVQETLPDQARVVRAALGQRYRLVGRGRSAEGRGEGNPLLYDGERLELLAADQLALSERPGEAGSRGWGSLVPRVVVVAEFRDRATSARFIAANTHLDVLSSRARLRSAEMIRELVAGRGLPAIVTGDFNAAPGSAAIGALQRGGVLSDAWGTARERTTIAWNTYVGYGRPRVGGRRIDAVFTTPQVRIDSAAIDARRVDGGRPSDHLPVHVVARLPAAGQDAAAEVSAEVSA